MTRLAIVLSLILALSAPLLAQSDTVVIAYFDAARLKSKGRQTELYDFRYFLPLIQQVIKRDFPNVQYRLAEEGDLVNLPDGTRLNPSTAKSPVGIILAARGKKRVELRGIQTDGDFGCAASVFFQRPSKACPKKKK